MSVDLRAAAADYLTYHRRRAHGYDGRRVGHAVSSTTLRVERSSAEANICRRGTGA